MLITKKTAEIRGTTICDAAGSAVSAFARRQMEKMGWSEGKGLGKKEDGLQSYIKVSKKDDNAGLGVAKVEATVHEVHDHWWHDGFSKHLKAFGPKKSKKSKKQEKSETLGASSAPPSYAELFAATGGARLGMRARAKQPGKILRTEGGLHHSDDLGKDTINLDNIIDESSGKKKRKSKSIEASVESLNEEASASASSAATEDKDKRKKQKKDKKRDSSDYLNEKESSERSNKQKKSKTGVKDEAKDDVRGEYKKTRKDKKDKKDTPDEYKQGKDKKKKQ
jgi:Pin2-interacting protein X1